MALEDPPGPAADDDADLGEPISAELARLEADLPLSAGFLERLERRIERRQVAADLGRLWWEVPAVVLRAVLRGALKPGRRPARRRPPERPAGSDPLNDEESEHG